MVWPIIRGKSYVGETFKSMKAVELAPSQEIGGFESFVPDRSVMAPPAKNHADGHRNPASPSRWNRVSGSLYLRNQPRSHLQNFSVPGMGEATPALSASRSVSRSTID